MDDLDNLGYSILCDIAEHPSGEWSCIAFNDMVYVLDPAWTILREFEGTADINMICSEDRIFVSENTHAQFAVMDAGAVRSLDVNGVRIAEHISEDGDLGPDVPAFGYAELALGPDHLLFVVGFHADDEEAVVVALDTRDLRIRFSFGRDVFQSMVYGMAVGGEELYVGEEDGWVHAFSLTGQHLRKMEINVRPQEIRYHDGRLYVLEKASNSIGVPVGMGKRIIVLTPEGEELQIFTNPDDEGEPLPLHHIFIVGGRLIVCGRAGSGEDRFFALKGL